MPSKLPRPRPAQCRNDSSVGRKVMPWPRAPGRELPNSGCIQVFPIPPPSSFFCPSTPPPQPLLMFYPATWGGGGQGCLQSFPPLHSSPPGSNRKVNVDKGEGPAACTPCQGSQQGERVRDSTQARNLLCSRSVNTPSCQLPLTSPLLGTQ